MRLARSALFVYYHRTVDFKGFDFKDAAKSDLRYLFSLCNSVTRLSELSEYPLFTTCRDSPCTPATLRS